MKIKRSIVCIILAVVLCISCVVIVGAVEPKASLYLDSYDGYVVAKGNGEVEIWFEVYGTRTMTQIGAQAIVLQEKLAGSSTWRTVANYNYADYDNMMGGGNTYHINHVDYEGVAGASYQAYITIWAGNNNGGDSRNITTEVELAY